MYRKNLAMPLLLLLFISLTARDDSYELCDCGQFYAHELESWTSTPPLNYRMSHPFGFGTHFTYQFENIHTYAYMQWETEYPDTIIIWPYEPLYDFSLISVNHNAICCAYVGDTLLAFDKLYPSDAVALTVALAHYLYPSVGIIFTDQSGTRHHMFLWQSMAGGCSPKYYVGGTDHLIDRRENWRDLEIISMPETFTYEIVGLHGDVMITINCTVLRDTAHHMWAGYLKVESIESKIEESLASSDFLFDDGHVGYMLEFDYEIWWVRGDWIAVSLRHDGDKFFFEIHENLILEIARTLSVR